MSEKKPLTADDARELLSDHVEGALADDVRAEVDALLAQDATLRAERAALAHTIAALHALPTPEAPSDMVAKVRARLANERRAALGQAADAGGGVLMQHGGVLMQHGGALIQRSRFRWGGVEAAIGLAAAASIAVFVMVAGMPKTAAPTDTQTAGIGAAEGAIEVTLVAPGFSREQIVALATQAGMDTLTADAVEGDGRAAARFVLMLRSEALTRGVEISGVVPEARRVRLTIKTAPTEAAPITTP